jgi:hypothetical protein
MIHQDAVTAVIPGSRVAHRFTVLKTSDGKLKYRSDRTIGIVTNPATGQGYYCSRGKSDKHLRNQAKPVVLPLSTVQAFDRVAVPSDNARRQIGL